jgi:hypothetical protein
MLTKKCEYMSSNFTNRVPRRMFGLRKKEERGLNKIENELI